MKLSEAPVETWGSYQLPVAQAQRFLTFSDLSLKKTDKKSIGGLLEARINGKIINTNTIESFHNLDFDQQMKEHCADPFIECINEGSWMVNSSLLNNFLLVSFADLKSYLYQYAYCPLEIESFSVCVTKGKRLRKVYNEEEQTHLSTSINEFLKSHDSVYQPGFMLYNTADHSISLIFEDFIEHPESYLILYIDPSMKQPSSVLKNLLFAISTKLSQDTSVKIVSLRDKISKMGSEFTFDQTSYLEVNLSPSTCEGIVFKQMKKREDGNVEIHVNDLKKVFDPTHLAESAVGLNLKLMKWRMAPDINLDVIKDQKCLLLGSGSLGCQIGRNLLSWGFTKFTFVDYGNVSYSNPVRQCLFTFQDSVDGRSKSEAAAQRLKEVFPSIDTHGVKLKIPMPGHDVRTTGAEEEMKEDYRYLNELIKSHDIIFLITDSRESRWLPSVLASVHKKVCLTVALGFETFLVLRQGLPIDEHDPEINGPNRLGCYFCNDTVAPRNSQRDRTLDQQCTVTRPAMCALSSAIAAELLVALLNHPLQRGAKADEELFNCDRSSLGPIPHQIRGDLSEYKTIAMCGEAFDMCIGCSKTILDHFRGTEEEALEFLKNACNHNGFLEEQSGLAAKLAQMDLDMDDFAVDDFDIDDEDDEQIEPKAD